MKKIFLLANVFLLLALSFMACSDDDGTGDIYMKIEEVRFTPKGGETDLDLKVSGSFEVVPNQDWIEVWRENDKIMLKVPPFFSGVNRTGSFDIITKTSSRKVTVLQRSDFFEILGDKKVVVPFEGKEHKVTLNSSFENGESRMHVRCKDEADKDWINGEFINTTEVLIKINSSTKPRNAVVYLTVDGDVEETVMDSLVVNSVITKAEDFNNTKWIATFKNREGTDFSEEVEITMNSDKQLILKGIPAYEDRKNPVVEIPFDYSSSYSSITISFGNTKINPPILKESDSRYVYLQGMSNEYKTWKLNVEKSPKSYKGELIIDDAGNTILDLSSYSFVDYSTWSWYELIGFRFGAFGDTDGKKPLGAARVVVHLKLTLK